MHRTRNNAVMVSAVTMRLPRVLYAVAALSLSFSGCTCGGSAPRPPAPTPTTRAAAPPPATAAPAAPAAQAPAAAAQAAPAAAPPATAAVAAADAGGAPSDCAAYAAVWAGRKQDPAIMANPEARKYAAAELVMCGAVYSDSDDLCSRIMGVDEGPLGACLQTRALFHELRAYPGKPSFMFTEFEWKRTRGIPALTQFADSLQQALRSGKPEDCDKVGDGASICRAYMKLDKNLCVVSGQLAEVEFSLPDHKEGEPTSYKVKDVAEANCRENIESRSFLNKGLDAIAASGPPRERELAKAALRQPDACEALMQAAIARCTGPAPTVAAPTPISPPPPDDGGAPQGGNAQG
jgi:hypothetical protein